MLPTSLRPSRRPSFRPSRRRPAGRPFSSPSRRLRRSPAALAAAGLLALVTVAAAGCHARPAPHGAAKVNAILARMTLAEKIRLLHGSAPNPAQYQGQAGYWAGNRKLGIPPMRMADGPPGVLTRHRSTAPVATMGVAATFSAAAARREGRVIGRDARALGIAVALQPFLNIFRDPTWARAYNTYGEDPLLSGEIGAGVIRGIQSQGVMATAKHFLAYNGGGNVIVGQQALHQIYAEPFAYAVRAGVAAVMCSYNQVNGAYACGNSATLRGVLKQEIGFRGFVMSDWGATHATDFLAHGLDLEMPGSMIPFLPCYFCARPAAAPPHRLNVKAMFFSSHIPEEPPPAAFGGFGRMAPPEGMLAAVKNKTVTPAQITAAARRILMAMDRFGYLRGKAPWAVSAAPFARDVRAVEAVAEDAAVLLKNRGHALPLTTADLHSLALIGPGAAQTVTIGESGEKALGFPSRDLSPYAALLQETRGIAGRHVTLSVADDMTGHPIPARYLSSGGHPGLRRAGSGPAVRDAQINFTQRDGRPLPAGTKRQWSGVLRIPRTGDYWLYLQVMGCAAQFRVDGHLAGRTANLLLHGNYIQAAQDNVLPTTDNLDNVRVSLHLTAGSHPIQVRETADGSGRPVQIRLAWMTPRQRQADWNAALAAAKAAHTVVVFAWGRGLPAYQLPGDQNRLIAAIARVNPRTIVVLNTSQPDALPWLPHVAALLEMWYPGDGGGPATARVLLGKTDPGGRLPFTWAQRLDQYVSHDPAHPARSSRGVHGVTRFSEGIFVGYRWFDQQKIQPLFPFGFGLTYTRFHYSGLAVRRDARGGLAVSFAVRNVGPVAGDAVPQVYLGPPQPAPSGAQFAVRALAGFARLHLKPGQTQSVTIRVPRRQLQYWADGANHWRLAAGKRWVFVGASSRHLLLRKQFTVAP